MGRLVLFELLFGSFGLGNIGELLRLQVVQSKTGGQTSVVLSAVSIVELSTELQLCPAKSEQQKYKTKANLDSWTEYGIAAKQSLNRINSQSLEDTQVGYISQKYTLDKHTLEKYT